MEGTALVRSKQRQEGIAAPFHGFAASRLTIDDRGHTTHLGTGRLDRI
jgi:hypothetical protein